MTLEEMNEDWELRKTTPPIRKKCCSIEEVLPIQSGRTIGSMYDPHVGGTMIMQVDPLTGTAQYMVVTDDGRIVPAEEF